MKLRCTIIKEISPAEKSIIVRFEDDSKKQEFEVHFKDLNPYAFGMRKWDTWLICIKFESEVFEDSKIDKKSYFTHLIGSKPKLISSVMGK